MLEYGYVDCDLSFFTKKVFSSACLWHPLLTSSTWSSCRRALQAPRANDKMNVKHVDVDGTLLVHTQWDPKYGCRGTVTVTRFVLIAFVAWKRLADSTLGKLLVHPEYG